MIEAPSTQRLSVMKMSKLAVLSFVFGCLALGFVISHAPPLLVLAVPLGCMALCTGLLARWLIRRAAVPMRGRKLARLGTTLGPCAAVLSVVVIAGMIRQQVQQQNQWQRQMHAQQAMAVSKMPETPTTNFTSNLPIVVLHTGGHYISKEDPTVIRAEFFDTREGRASSAAKPNYAGLGSIHVRGTSTAQLPKHSYTFHVLDGKTNQTKVSLLGLPAEEDWVLYSAFEDKTLMRDVLAFELAREMGGYAPRTRYIELFISNSERPLSMRDYAGVYVLMEKIKRGKERVNIAKLEPEQKAEPEITGGYIIKRDHHDRNERRFHTSHGGPYYYVYPKADAITPAQRNWLTSYLNRFEDALYGPDFADPGRGYAAYLDVDAFIDEHWLIELSKNVDGFRYSTFLTKDRGGKLKTGPPWDWNRAFGNANYYGGAQTQGWYSSNLRPNEISWFHRLREDPAFVRRCNARWLELRKTVLDPKKINARIDELAASLEEAQRRNFQRWPVLGQQINSGSNAGNSYADEVRWLKEWTTRRMAWIDKQVGKPKETDNDE